MMKKLFLCCKSDWKKASCLNSGAMRSAQEWLNFQVGGNRKMGGENLAEQRRELKKVEDELAAIRASDEYNQKIEEGRGRIRYLENRRASVSRAARRRPTRSTATSASRPTAATTRAPSRSSARSSRTRRTPAESAPSRSGR